jgi:hypothetical protein
MEGRIWVTFARWNEYHECGLGCSRDPSRFEDRYVTASTDSGWTEPASLGLPLYGGNFDLQLDSAAVVGGTFDAAYVVAGRGSPRVEYATNASGEWADSVERVAEGFDPHLAFASDGEPRIAFSTGEGRAALAIRVDGGWESWPVHMGETDDATLEAFLVDSSDQEMVIFSVFEADAGYRSYVTVREEYDSTSTYPLADGVVEEALLGANDSVHGLYSIVDSEASHGLWHARGLIGVETRISESVRLVPDGAAAAHTLVVDSSGTPHVLYATPYDNVEALMYAIGPTP